MKSNHNNLVRFAFVGPYFRQTAQTEFEVIRPSDFVQTVLDRCLEKHGIKIMFGRWLVTTGIVVDQLI
jgi:hypothetical protein